MIPFNDLALATGETACMVAMSTFFSILFGLPLGTLLYSSSVVAPNRMLNRVIAGFINFTRSIPFIILLVALIPVTRFIVGTSIGLYAAMVPLTLGAIPFVARLVDNVYQNLSEGLIETSHAMGATTWQTVRYVIFPEAIPALIQTVTITAITLVNYSAMAGTVGGGGLGDLAIRYGYQRFDMRVMAATVVILVIMVQLLQMAGDYLARRFQH